jgi:hypothetical protein
MVGAIDVEVVEVDIVNAGSEWYDLWLWSGEEGEVERKWVGWDLGGMIWLVAILSGLGHRGMLWLRLW